MIVRADIAANVWKVEVAVGDRVEAEQVLAILESMKMEIPITVPDGGKVADVLVKEGDAVTEGQTVAIVEG